MTNINRTEYNHGYHPPTTSKLHSKEQTGRKKDCLSQKKETRKSNSSHLLPKKTRNGITYLHLLLKRVTCSLIKQKCVAFLPRIFIVNYCAMNTANAFVLLSI